jgi:hypothetical protein
LYTGFDLLQHFETHFSTGAKRYFVFKNDAVTAVTHHRDFVASLGSACFCLSLKNNL